MTKRRKRSNRRGSGGFTLIEMMMAMTITAVGLFSIIQSQYVAMRGHAMARERMEATMIAQGVMGEIRAQALGWSAMPGSIASSLITAAIPGIIPSAPPAVGVDIPFTDLRPWPSYFNRLIAPAASTARDLAYRINVRGESSQNTTNVLRALYRVHYVMYPLPVDPLQPTVVKNDLFRFIIVVSWDNKDHGEQSYLWDTEWAQEAHFFKRQIVILSFNVTQNKLY